MAATTTAQVATPARRPIARRADLPGAAAVVFAVFAAFTMPFGVGHERRGYDLHVGYSLMLQYGLLDAVLLAALAVCAVPTARRLVRRQTPLLITAGALLVLALAVSFVVHPIDRGALIVLRLAATVAIADVVSVGRHEVLRPFGIGVAAVAVGEWLLAIYQLIAGGSLGLWFLGERPHPLVAFGTAFAPSGTFFWGYPLCAFLGAAAGVTFALVLGGRLHVGWAIATAAAAGSAPMLTYARFGLVTIVLLSAVLVVCALFHRRARRTALVLIAVMGVSVFATRALHPAGWAEKARIATSTGDVTNGRVGLLRENVEMLLDHPLVGVGVGRYTTTLIDEGRLAKGAIPKPPHFVPMAALTEAGLLAVPSLALTSVAALLLVWRRRWLSLLAFVSVLSPIALDQYVWNTPEGMAIVAIAWGVASIANLDVATATPGSDAAGQLPVGLRGTRGLRGGAGQAVRASMRNARTKASSRQTS